MNSTRIDCLDPKTQALLQSAIDAGRITINTGTGTPIEHFHEFATKPGGKWCGDAKVQASLPYANPMFHGVPLSYVESFENAPMSYVPVKWLSRDGDGIKEPGR